MLITAVLAVLVGFSLGLLGGGGSVLTVPLLLYGAVLEPKIAIATSLLVVASTASASAVTHARAGRVRWRTALTFGGSGMAGAFLGGRIATLLPASVLLVALTVVMVAAGLAMMRARGGEVARERSVPAMIALGFGVGAVTGLVGAGGGFLVVPALVVFGGLAMDAAIGTALVVVAMQALAGLAAHAADVDLHVGLVVSLAAIGGGIAGGKLSGRVPQAVLRKGFAWLVLLTAAAMAIRQAPPELARVLLVERWPWWAGGLAIAGVVLSLLWSENTLLGVSTGCAELCRLGSDASVKRSWRPSFLMGIALGGVLAGVLSGAHPTLGGSPAHLALLAGAGVMIGWGARKAGGCTSGHSIVGVAQGARSSLIATGGFLAAGFAVTQLARALS